MVTLILHELKNVHDQGLVHDMDFEPLLKCAHQTTTTVKVQ